MSIVERLERELGKPVLANNAVSLWAGLRLLRHAMASNATARCCATISLRERAQARQVCVAVSLIRRWA